MTRDEVKAIIAAARAKGEVPNLTKADLRGANLTKADLRGADLRGADLRGADLRGADLRVADLRVADLTKANLYGADLRGANLRVADLTEANLYGADLRGANLRGANLRVANLRGADLRVADLTKADLRGADLTEADLTDCVGAALALARASHVPSTGPFHAWKKCKDGVLVKLLIPEDAARSHGAERKCRASKAVVLEVLGAEVGVSMHDGRTEYRAGQEVIPDGWNPDRWETCGQGIHFYVTREEAEAHEQ